MKNAIITGSTGMIGNLILQECLQNPAIGKVTIVNRRASGQQHDKLVEVIHGDFKDFSKIADHFTGQDIAFYCIGVYTGAVARDKFRMITVDFTKAFAETLRANSPEATFCFLSGQGADQTEKSRVMFAKDKGIAENILLSLAFKALYIFRPAYIYPVTPRQEPNFSYRIFRMLYPIVKSIFPQSAITSVNLAKGMFLAGLNGASKTVLENEDIKAVS